VALTERQKKAQTLAHELRAAGATVTSALPLFDGSPLRFRVLAPLAEEIVADLKKEGWSANFVTSGPEFHLNGSTPLANTYEIHIPIERTAIPGDRITGELATGKKPSGEAEAMLKHLGYK